MAIAGITTDNAAACFFVYLHVCRFDTARVLDMTATRRLSRPKKGNWALLLKQLY